MRIFWRKGIPKGGKSPRNQYHYPKERDLKLEKITFTKTTIYFSNATSKITSSFNNWVNGVMQI
jgi:hypothetical protein